MTAGDVIGYLGMSGYSTKENTNNINVPHLHFGLQLIFDESQKDSNNEIWIDLYDFVEFLQQNKSAVGKGRYQRVLPRLSNARPGSLRIIRITRKKPVRLHRFFFS